MIGEADRQPRNALPSDGHPHGPVFIVGMPRTGTTVLERILGGHPQVADAGELNDFQHAASQASNRFIRLPLGLDDIAALASVDPQVIGTNYLERTAWRYVGRTRLIDKNPQNAFAAGLIATALPQARILCLVRDPVDACFSNLKELFAPGAYAYSYDLQEVADHYARFRRLVDHLRSSHPEQFLVVDYENLVADPVQVTEAVLRFCGLPPEPECVDITSNLSPSSTASSSQVRQPIHARAVGAWRNYRHYLQPMIERLHEHGFASDGQ
ncbi:MAG: sulfotransferase [Luteimonas sp.]